MTRSVAGLYDAVVLAGGTSRRMGGGDKTTLEVGGMALLDRALEAVGGASTTFVVGRERPTQRRVTWTVEEPPGGGPAAALAAGLALVESPVVVTLAADLPFVTRRTIERLVQSAQDGGAVFADSSGAPQWLLGAWSVEVLRKALAGDQTGHSLRAALAPLTPTLLTSESPRPEWFDCDEPDDLVAAKELLP